MAKKLEIKLIRGVIGTTDSQRRTVQALGLKRRMHSVTKAAVPSILGMIETVRHLLEVKEID